ncbi:MAG: HicB family protein [Gammaproteobacteria bacterium]|nr:HicB family protein [Gammaproteobacteria bacterium]MYD80367.1 HicB family protein [Gammaproteobacteria bacterium]
MKYSVVVHKDVGSDYGVTVPDLPGCFSAGQSFEEALESVKEAIVCHLEGLLMDKVPFPERATMVSHQANRDYRGGTWAFVDVDVSSLSC